MPAGGKKRRASSDSEILFSLGLMVVLLSGDNILLFVFLLVTGH